MTLSRDRNDLHRDSHYETADGKVAVRTGGSGSVIDGLVFDAIGATYPTALTEVYTYYQGGLAGTVAATVTVTYQDVEKCIVVSVVRS